MLLALYFNGTLLPPFGIDGLWFYSAFAAVILGEFLIEPFFTRPADALANSVALVIGCASVSVAGAQIDSNAARAGRLGFVIFGLLLIGLACVAIALKDRPGQGERIAQVSARVVGRAGQARFMFSLLLFAAGYAAFADDAGKIAVLYLSWFAIAFVAPLEVLIGVWLRRRDTQPERRTAGVVERLEDPGVIIARLPRGARPRVGMVATIGDAATGVVVDATALLDEPRVRVALEPGERAAVGARVVVDEDKEPGDGPIVGFVGEGTTLTDVRVRTAASASDFGLAEGRLLQAPIGAPDVLFQVTEAVIVGEASPDGSRDIINVTARKLGVWNPTSRLFESASWLPLPGTAARLLAHEGDAFVADEVGHVPGTVYGVRVDLNRIVTHNTAVLGVLGVGKTHLAWELIQRMLDDGIKVLVLDITGQYSEHLSDICSPDTENLITEKLNRDVAANLNNRTVRGQQAGNVAEFGVAVHELLKTFLEGDERLLVLNPSRLEASRMEGRPFQGQANYMLRLTMVEITHIIAETMLSLVDDEFTDRARACLVFEEAHSLAPEWNSAVHEGERSAVNGIARAILQGRKYGLGCLLITQRTANVTKSILNQCNTIFALRTYDSTGMGFLQNYIGASHAQLLAALPERHAVVFGRASSSNAPIIVKLNDAAALRAGFWEPRLEKIPVTKPPNGGDDIPF